LTTAEVFFGLCTFFRNFGGSQAKNIFAYFFCIFSIGFASEVLGRGLSAQNSNKAILGAKPT